MRFAEPIIHIDMDAFFVECERLFDPTLKGKPVAVGGGGNRGVIASASYEARAFGVHSAMPTVRAKRLCPKLVLIPSDHGRYGEVSRQVFSLVEEEVPVVERLSIDEAFLDVSGLTLLYPHSRSVAVHLRKRIRHEVGIPASCGIASNKFLAKLASGKAKPDGIFVMEEDRQLALLHAFDVRAMWGVGEATYAGLERLGVKTIGDLAGVGDRALQRTFGRSAGNSLYRLSMGIDDRVVEPHGEAKSISNEQTYDEDLQSDEEIRNEVKRHADRLSTRLRQAHMEAKTVSIKIRFDSFETISRSLTLASPTAVGQDLMNAAVQLLDRAGVRGRRVRLIGVGGSALVPASQAVHQLATDRPASWDDLAEAVGEIRDRFGHDAVVPAVVHQKKENPISDIAAG